MEYILKVSPKGQVVLPKKLRETLHVTELVAIEVKDDTAIVRKPTLSSEQLAGCFRGYASGKRVSSKRAVEIATEMVAHETARKGH